MKLIELYLRPNWTLSWFFCNQTVGVAVKCVHKFFDMPPFKWWHLIIFLLNMGHPYNLFLVKMMWEKWFSVVPVARSSQGQFLPGSLPLGLLILGEASHHVICTLRQPYGGVHVVSFWASCQQLYEWIILEMALQPQSILHLTVDQVYLAYFRETPSQSH